MVVFFTETYLAATRRSFNLNLALIALIICFFTRQLFLVYLPAILLAFYILFVQSENFTKKRWIPLFIFIIFLILNIPSLLKNGELSYDKKSPPENMEVTWTQRQYLAQLMVNRGDLPNYQHPSWEQTKNYLIENGKESLPDNIIKGIFQDPGLTLKEFFKDFFYILIYSSRGIGLILLITIGHFILRFLNHRKLYLQDFIPIASLVIIAIFSLIIISYIELRWLCAIFIMLVIYYGDLLKNNRIDHRIELVNLIYFCSIALFGIFRIFSKTF